MDRSRRLPLLVAAAPLVMGATSFFACSGERSADGGSLRRSFPAQADHVLASGRSFERSSDGGFAARLSRGLEVTLPARGDGDVVFTTPEGRTIRVHEDLAAGPAAVEESAVRYARAGGTSYWTLEERGVEEWLDVDASAVVRGEPVATWTVEGARFAEIEGTVAVLDDSGRALLRVTAPKAYGVDGREIAVDLDVVDGRLALNVDAANERVLVDPFWTIADDMIAQRSNHVAVALTDGRVLVAGGSNDTNFAISGVEIYDPATELWIGRAAMPSPVERTAAARIADGDVVVFGGWNGDPFGFARRYDVGTNAWTNLVPGMLASRADHTATLLLDGRVFIFGGSFGTPGEIFDPAPIPPTFTATGGEPPAGVSNHTATLLLDGRVLIAGGGTSEGSSLSVLYDPAQNDYTTTQPMNQGRLRFAATRLLDGRVMVSGGDTFGGTSVDIFDPAQGTWTAAAAMGSPRYNHTLTTLPDGRVVAAGGSLDVAGSSFTGSTAIYDPFLDQWENGIVGLFEARSSHTATLLGDGTVLAAGGRQDVDRLDSSEIFEPRNDIGDSCETPAECASGFCVDSNCCNEACIGECRTCDNEGSGICIDVTNDTPCALGTCQDGTCVADGLPNGAPCLDGSECESGACIDDVCCNDQFCFGDCQACSEAAGAETDGECGPTPDVPCFNGFNCADVDICSPQGVCLADPDEEICPVTECLENSFCGKGTCIETPRDDGTPCSNNGTCEDGICIGDPLENGEPCIDGIQCASGNCFDEVCCNVECFGQCQACSIEAGGEEDGVCSPANDGDFCGKGGVCSDGECTNLNLNGQPCEADDECLSDSCVDDVCCDTVCTGLCVACSVEEGAEEDGVCATVEDGTTCGEGGLCEDGECDTLLPNGEACEQEDECESDNCVDDVCCNTACVGECIACSGGTNDGTCQPVEDGTACEGGSCDDGLCVLDSPKELGEPCEAAEECDSEQCVDGVCCDSACDGECDACSTDEGADENGTCGNATGSACDDGNACTQLDTCDAQACVGSDPVECTPGACQTSSTCAQETGACVPISLPDGAPCEGGVCIAGACQTDPDVGSLSGSGTGNPSGAGPGGTGNGSGPSGTASGPSGATGAGAGNGSGDDGEDGAADGESSDGCSVAPRDGGPPRDLGWLAIAALIGARWRRSRRRGAQAGEGRRVEP